MPVDPAAYPGGYYNDNGDYVQPDGRTIDATTREFSGTTTTAANFNAGLTAYRASNIGLPAAPSLTDEQKSAQGIINSTLSQYGLSSLATNAWNQYLSGTPIDTVLFNIRSTPEWQTRFKAIVDFQKNNPGLRPPSETDVLNFENTATGLAHQYGLPTGFMTQAETDALIAGNVSMAELSNRVKLASDATFGLPPEDAQALESMYGLGAGHGALTAFFLDPTKALPLIQSEFSAGRIGGAAIRSGFGPLSAAEAENIGALGVSPSQAAQGFGTLYNERELAGVLPGEAGTAITRADQLGAAFGGDTVAQEAFARRAAQRKALFGGSEDFATTAAGVRGLATANPGA